ncbi:MAG: DUF5618 family protein [Bacteroidales bacterium]|nr:DUF5618 family protein [Bacteroidales bacterium]
MEKKDPISEARRYLENAKEILRDKAIEDDCFYQNGKYVKLAGRTMWKGCTIALDYALDIKKKHGRQNDIDDYKEKSEQIDKNLFNHIVSGYNILYYSLGCDGEKKVDIARSGIETMNYIIDWCEHRMQGAAA